MTAKHGRTGSFGNKNGQKHGSSAVASDAKDMAQNGSGGHGRKNSSSSIGRQGSLPATHATAGEHDKGKRMRSFLVRTVSTVVLIGSFVIFIYWGHVPLMFMVLGIQFTMVRELFAIASVMKLDQGPGSSRHSGGRRGPLPSFKVLQWFWFWTMAFFLYFRFIRNNLMVEITSSARLAHLFGWALKHYGFAAFCLYTAGFIGFVLTLEKSHYSYQFKQFAWTHMILITVFVPSSFFVSNIFEGLIWFLLPTSLVIINDIFAYLAGFFFGRTPLIKLSPKKTWEGFVGGMVATLAAAWYLALLLAQFKWMTCPRTDLTVWGPLECPADALYQAKRYELAELLTQVPPAVQEALGACSASRVGSLLMSASISAMPMQLHALMLGIVASFVSPFGGFFASGFKRAFKIKDFGDSIPGHGGMTDRMDCQIVMAVLSYMYFNHFVGGRDAAGTVAVALAAAIRMPDARQLELFERLSVMLAGEGLIPDQLSEQVAAAVGAALQRLERD